MQLIQGSETSVPISPGEPVYSPFPPRKKKREKGKKKGSDDSDSDDVEVIKEWNTSSRGRNGEGRNRRASVEERKCRVCTVWGISDHSCLKGQSCLDVMSDVHDRT